MMGVTWRIRFWQQPHPNDSVDYNDLLFCGSPFHAPGAAAYLPKVTGVTMTPCEAIMNVRPDLRMSKAAFLEWNAGEGERCELVGGRVVMMPRPSQAHGMIVMNLAMLLRNRLDPKQWVVIMEFGVDSGPETLRYPDIVVYPAGSPGKSYTTSAPVLLVEVLSPSSVESDLGDKAIEYQELPSLIAYIVLSQDEPKAWVWRRDSATHFTQNKVSGVEATIPVGALQLELPMADIYAGVEAD
jgi:Uma2 family endonuclease